MTTSSSGPRPEQLINIILKAVRGLQYGSLEIVIHDSRIVRIEKHERIRLDFESDNATPTATAEAQPHSKGPHRTDSTGPDLETK